jgi:hypothetical protein
MCGRFVQLGPVTVYASMFGLDMWVMDMERPGRCYPAAVLVEPAIACFGRLRLLYMLMPVSSIFENVGYASWTPVRQ